jgi:hypothetical protein
MTIKPELSGELRNLVRDALREAMAGRTAPGLSTIEAVRIASDTDLQAFVQRLLDPAVQERVRSGKLRFSLAAAAGAAAGPATTAAGAPLNGVVTEKIIERHSSSQTLVLAPEAVLTPLARDRTRQLGMKIERRR